MGTAPVPKGQILSQDGNLCPPERELGELSIRRCKVSRWARRGPRGVRNEGFYLGSQGCVLLKSTQPVHVCTAAGTSPYHRFAISTKLAYKNFSLRATRVRISPVNTRKLCILALTMCMSRASSWDHAATQMHINGFLKKKKYIFLKQSEESGHLGCQNSHQGVSSPTLRWGRTSPLLPHITNQVVLCHSTHSAPREETPSPGTVTSQQSLK